MDVKKFEIQCFFALFVRCCSKRYHNCMHGVSADDDGSRHKDIKIILRKSIFFWCLQQKGSLHVCRCRYFLLTADVS